MSYVEKCEIKGCENDATRISSTETKYIVICDDCWHDKYKNQGSMLDKLIDMIWGAVERIYALPEDFFDFEDDENAIIEE